jgi:hypothetical protein
VGACGQRSLDLSCWLCVPHLVDGVQRADKLEHHTSDRLFRYAMCITYDEGQIRTCATERQSVQRSFMARLGRKRCRSGRCDHRNNLFRLPGRTPYQCLEHE